MLGGCSSTGINSWRARFATKPSATCFPPSHFLIAINPACEVWLLDRTAELGKTPADFGLSNDFEAFKAFRKSPAAERGPQLRALLAAVATTYHPVYRASAEFVADIMDLDHPLP